MVPVLKQMGPPEACVTSAIQGVYEWPAALSRAHELNEPEGAS